jgi:hypothetical protein
MKGIPVSMVLLLSVLLASGVSAQEGSVADLSEGVQAVPEATAMASPAVSGVNVLRLIRFSGTARGAQGQALAGTVGVTFALYGEQEGGTPPLWLETQNVSLDAQGRYTALLGATSNEGLPLELFSSGQARWLGIQVQGQAEQRVLLVAVPYALKAAEAETLAGKTASDFVLSKQLSTQVEEEINTQIEEQGLVTSEDTPALVDGSGTTDQIAKFTSATDIGDSVMTEKNGRVGINFTSPVQFLVIGGTGGRMLNVSNLANQDLEIRVSTRLAADKFALIAPTTPTNLALGVGGDEKMRITNAGNVGIGTSTPSERLEVEGDFKVNAQTGGLRIKGNATSPNVIGGFSGNSASGGVVGAAIGGGGQAASTNLVTDDHGTIGGGRGNQAGDSAGTTTDADGATVGGGNLNAASANQATVGGGGGNTASASNTTVSGGGANIASDVQATVGGGGGNTASAVSTTVSGGGSNTATADFATTGGGRFNNATASGATVGGGQFNNASGANSAIGGGALNAASGDSATVPGGQNNTASGDFSFAAGRRAKATHNGAFVWGDSTDADIASSGADQFIVRASGGFFLHNGTEIYFNTFGGQNIQVGAGTTGCVVDRDSTIIAGTCASDARLKKDIEPFEPLLDKVLQLRPVHFDWRAEEYPERGFGASRSYGLIAQDVEAVLPELVTEDAEGYKAVRYSKLPLLLLQALRELKAENDGLGEQLRAQEEQASLLLEAVKEQQTQLRALRNELETVKAELQEGERPRLADLAQE